MANLKQKTRLASLLKKMGDPEYNEAVVIEQILDEIEKIRGSIPTIPDLSPYYNDVNFLKDKTGSLTFAITSMASTLVRLETKFSEDMKRSSESHKKISKDALGTIETLRKDIERLNKILTNPKEGGGSMNRSILINGTNYLTRYTDINIINSGATAVNNDTLKRVDITLTGGGSSGFQVPTGIVNGINKIFTFTTAPNVVVVDSGRVIRKVSADNEINWTGTTTITLEVSPNNDVFSTN